MDLLLKEGDTAWSEGQRSNTPLAHESIPILIWLLNMLISEVLTFLAVDTRPYADLS